MVIAYKELDKLYPNSKFILTVRDINSWLDSYEKHIKHKIADKFEVIVRKKIFKTIRFDEKKMVLAYKKHEKDVLKYFKHRPKDLLIINLSNLDSWKVLCEFLNKEIPNTPFPHLNKSNLFNGIINRIKFRYKKIKNIFAKS